MKYPLHLPNSSTGRRTKAQTIQAIELHIHMAGMRPNGNGFRQVPTSKKGSKSRAKQKQASSMTRVEQLMAELQ